MSNIYACKYNSEINNNSINQSINYYKVMDICPKNIDLYYLLVINNHNQDMRDKIESDNIDA